MRKIILLLILIMMTAIPARAEWSEPVNMGPSINTADYSEGYPRVSSDGSILYFMSTRSGTSQDIYYSIKEDTGWTQAMPIGPPINTEIWNEFAPMPSPDNLSLYFAAWRPGGYGDRDIWVSNYDTLHQHWLEPYPLPPPIGSSETEDSPTITEDGLYLFMYAAGSDPDPGPFMVSHWSEGEGWGPKIDTHIDLNAQSDPAITGDGRELYFDRSRPNIGRRIYKCIKTGDCDTCWSDPELLPYPINDTICHEPYYSISDSRLYFVSLTEGDLSGDIWYSDYISTDVRNQKPEDTEFYINTAPNPFNSSCRIIINFPKSCNNNILKINIYDIHGKGVIDWEKRIQGETSTFYWNGNDNLGKELPSGIYFYKATCGQYTATDKITIIR